MDNALAEVNKYSEFTAVYEGESDRAVAILAVSYLENALEKNLLNRLVSHNRVENLFRGYGPLATFSAKINVAYAVGLIPEHITKDLHTLRKIRNRFAHETTSLNFGSQAISDLCGCLSYVEGLPRTDGTFGRKPNGPREIFMLTVFWSVSHLESNGDRLNRIEKAKYVWKEVIDECEI